MIEFLLIFGFGFLVAILLTMLVTPAIYNRIVKLTENRIRATVPLSAAEVRGKLDMARAAYASDNARLTVELSRERDMAAEAQLETQHYQSELAGLAGRLQEAEQRIETLINESDRLHSEARRKDQHAETLSHQITELHQHRNAANREMAQMYNDLVAATTELENLRIDLATSETETLNLNAQLESERDQRRKVEQELAAARSAAREFEANLNAEQDRHNEARINLSAALSSVYNMEEDLKRANDRAVDIETERDAAAMENRTARDRVESLEGEISEWKRKWDDAQAKIERTGSRLDELSRQVSGLESERNRLLAEADSAAPDAVQPGMNGHMDGDGPASAEQSALAEPPTAPETAETEETESAHGMSDGGQDQPHAGDTPAERESENKRSGDIAALLEKLQTSVRKLALETTKPGPDLMNDPLAKTDIAKVVPKPDITEITDIQKQQNDLVERLRHINGEEDRERLRDDMADLAARVVTFAAGSEGNAFPLRDMLQAAPAFRQTGVDGAGNGRLSLADRIIGKLEEQA